MSNCPACALFIVLLHLLMSGLNCSCWIFVHHLHCALWASDGHPLQEAELFARRTTISEWTIYNPMRSLLCSYATTDVIDDIMEGFKDAIPDVTLKWEASEWNYISFAVLHCLGNTFCWTSKASLSMTSALHLDLEEAWLSFCNWICQWCVQSFL